MESSSVNGMCRCCASEGAFKDIKTSYHWMGDEEVYADMLRECFDVNLSSGDQGGICEVCITQLRNAANFKKQVLHTEEQFKQHLRSKGFKAAQVKEEMSGFDDNDSDDMDNCDDEDYVPEYEIPIKTESESEEKPKKRSAKAVSTRSKKSKSSDDAAAKSNTCETGNIKVEINVSSDSWETQTQSVNAVNIPTYPGKKTTPVLVSKKSDKIKPKNIVSKCLRFKLNKPMSETQKRKEELRKHMQNLQTILMNTNATPLRNDYGMGYDCCFCAYYCSKLANLKCHILEKHSKEKNKYMITSTLSNYCAKLDITDLKCQLCEREIDTLESIVKHLTVDHGINMFTDIMNLILPVTFKGDVFVCVLCHKKFQTLKLIQEHMNSHYKNFVCTECDVAYIHKRGYSAHLFKHNRGEFKCSFCSKVFNTDRYKRNHEMTVHKGDHKRNKCPICGEKFSSCALKIKHMKKEHNIEPRLLKCTACEKSFLTQDGMTKHVKRIHLMEKNYPCQNCDKRFSSSMELQNHMLSHTGEKVHRCEHCSKAYGRKCALREHMRIHMNDRRFKCEHCGMTFVQKCSWKSHMRSKHNEIVQ